MFNFNQIVHIGKLSLHDFTSAEVVKPNLSHLKAIYIVRENSGGL